MLFRKKLDRIYLEEEDLEELFREEELHYAAQLEGFSKYSRRSKKFEEANLHGRRGAKSNLTHHATRQRTIYRKYARLKMQDRWTWEQVTA